MAAPHQKISPPANVFRQGLALPLRRINQEAGDPKPNKTASAHHNPEELRDVFCFLAGRIKG